MIKQKHLPGHFYSTIPDATEILENRPEIFNRNYRHKIPGVELDIEHHRKMCKLFSEFLPAPFTPSKKKSLYYYGDRGSYPLGDATILYFVMRYLKPKKIIEVGSGSSSCAMMDINRFYLNSNVELTFIDPYSEKLPVLPKQNSHGKLRLVRKKVQDIDKSFFNQLQKNDILFIDSTHVSKLDSDVNYLVHSILPILSKGVYIHIHDIFYPFEYPRHWIENGIYWNEAYLLRSFLQFNSVFSIFFWNSFVYGALKDEIDVTLNKISRHGASIWLKKHS